MNRRMAGFVAATVLFAAGADAQTLRTAGANRSAAGSELRCAELASLDLPELTAIDAVAMPAGPFELPAAGPFPARSAALPGFCRVRGTVDPAIRFEVWLPFADNWNGRFQAVGGGGLAGSISYAAMAGALTEGYVTSSTDTGHVASDLEWLSDPRRLRDYGYRAIFEMTAKAKATIAAFYDRPADYNYFNGCSTGGRQGLMEAQRFPADYDGIVSGAPVNDFVDTHIAQLWVALASKPVTDQPNLTQSDLDFVAATVVAQCDARDGVTDGLIDDPRVCGFNPRTLQCGLGRTGRCLTAEQVDTLTRIYAGPVRPDTGERLHQGLAPGSESTWSVVTTPGLVPIPQAFFSRAVFADPEWDWRSFDFAGDTDLSRQAASPILDATDPDLSAFRDDGGKLIVYHGWNDQVIFPEGSIDYYERVQVEMNARGAGAPADSFFRLFMVPGMTHCAGGAGPDQFDAQAAIEDWVERGIAPDRLDASHVEDGRTTFTRPLCPYPQRARYRGTGDRDRAENFVCAR